MKCTFNGEVMFVGTFNAYDHQAAGVQGCIEGM
jgi:hypothetical protein